MVSLPFSDSNNQKLNLGQETVLCVCARVCMCVGAGSWGTRDLWGTVWLEDCSAVTIKSFSVSVSDKKAGTRKALGEKSTDSKELERDKGRD